MKFKYLKYKNKYLSLKNKIEGGGGVGSKLEYIKTVINDILTYFDSLTHIINMYNYVIFIKEFEVDNYNYFTKIKESTTKLIEQSAHYKKLINIYRYACPTLINIGGSLHENGKSSNIDHELSEIILILKSLVTLESLRNVTQQLQLNSPLTLDTIPSVLDNIHKLCQDNINDTELLTNI
jgi:hypothetical protein